MYGNKRKEKKNKKNVIKTHKATRLRALKAATKSAGGVLGKLLRTKGAAKARTVCSLHLFVGFENTLLEAIDRGGKTVDYVSNRCPLPVRLLRCSNYCGNSLPTKSQRSFTDEQLSSRSRERRHAMLPKRIDVFLWLR